MRSGIRVAGTAVGLLIALAGCGSTDDTATDDTATKAASPGSPSSRHSGVSRSPTSQGGGDDPYHIAAGDWPEDLTGAKALYDQMPVEFRTWPVKHPRSASGTAGVIYGLANNGADAFSMETTKEVPDARMVLSFMFGMTMICDKDTYQGTADTMQGGTVPGIGSDEDVDPWWFACQAKGKNHPFVVGWTSGDVGWLVATPDKDTSREFVDLMAAGTQ